MRESVEYSSIRAECTSFQLKEEQKPSYILLHNPEMMNRLIKMASDNSDISETVWSFVMTLPKHEMLAKKESRADFSENNFIENWCRFLGLEDIKNFPCVAYCLHNLTKLFEMKAKKSDNYLKEQRGKNCPKFLYYIYKTIVSLQYTPIIIKCLSYCLNLLNILWDTDYMKGFIADPEADFSSSCDIIKAIEGKSINTNEAVEALKACSAFHKNLLRLNSELLETVMVSSDYLQLYKFGIFYAKCRTAWPK